MKKWISKNKDSIQHNTKKDNKIVESFKNQTERVEQKVWCKIAIKMLYNKVITNSCNVDYIINNS